MTTGTFFEQVQVGITYLHTHRTEKKHGFGYTGKFWFDPSKTQAQPYIAREPKEAHHRLYYERGFKEGLAAFNVWCDYSCNHDPLKYTDGFDDLHYENPSMNPKDGYCTRQNNRYTHTNVVSVSWLSSYDNGRLWRSNACYILTDSDDWICTVETTDFWAKWLFDNTPLVITRDWLSSLESNPLFDVW